jgi:DNA-directed RNA polymerase subunit RPC12/RpoP
MGADEPQEIRRAVSGAAAVAIRDIVSKNPVAAGHFDGREATEVVARGDVTIVYFGDEWTSATMPRWIEGVPEIRALAGLPPVSATDDPELTALRAARRRRHEPESEDGQHYVCGRCGEHLTDEQIGESQERALPLCESRPVAWRTSVAAAVLSNGTRIACVGRTEAEAETMRRAAESQKEPR